MKKLYFAGPLFSQAEKEFNLILTTTLEKLGLKVFLPQRDGIEKEKPEYAHLTKDQKRKLLFATDRDEILKAEIFLFILDGRSPDEGGCVELGMAYYQKYLENSNKLLIGLHTDKRAAFINSRLNPMILIALDAVVNSVDELLDILKKHIPSSKKNENTLMNTN